MYKSSSFATLIKNPKLSQNISVKFDNSLYDCASDNTRAKEVAKSLVDTWVLASDIVQNRGGRFTAILQPVAYFGNPEVSYLDLESSRSLEAQYKAVYPLIIDFAVKRKIRFIDMTKFYDDCTDCYIDYCHVGPQAHKRLASNLVSLLAN